MEISDDRIDALSATDNSDGREDLSSRDIGADAREFVSWVHSGLDRELALIGIEAQQQADVFWAGKESAVEDAVPEDQTWVGTRVRMRGNSLEALWYRNQVVQTRAGGKRTYSRHIKKGTGMSYSMQRFQREPDWAKQVIQMVEDRYTFLRKRSALVAKMRRVLSEYESLLDAGYDAPAKPKPETSDAD